jgi:hypothetical protein
LIKKKWKRKRKYKTIKVIQPVYNTAVILPKKKALNIIGAEKYRIRSIFLILAEAEQKISSEAQKSKKRELTYLCSSPF